MQQSGVGKHHGRARGDATAVRRHRSARRLALPAYPFDSCFDSHLAPSERSLVSSQKYYLHSTMFAANKQQAPPGYLGSGAVDCGRGFGPLSECQQDARDLAVTSELVCFVRSSARKNPVSPLVFRFQFSQVPYETGPGATSPSEADRHVPRQGTVQYKVGCVQPCI